MNCNKAQKLYDNLADGLLAEPLAAELRRHLDECTDCRVLRQRSGRLQQLLALKRHENPPPAYFDNFLGDFHRRLTVETMKPTWRERLLEAFRIELAPAWSYGLAGACAAMFVAGIFLTNGTGNSTGGQAIEPVAVASATADTATPAITLASSPERPVVNVAWHPQSARPQYVLERIAVTPVSYETASVRF